MTAPNLSQTLKSLTTLVRQRWDKLGIIDGEESAFATGYTPTIAPHAYLCRFYAGLSDAELDAAEEESERYLPPQYREFLASFNGAEIMGIRLNGFTGGQNLRNTGALIGQPISIRYQNAFYLRPDYIPEGHFGIGAINGEWYSQGHLYLTSLGAVELINAEHDLLAAKWPSLADFLSQEVPRQMSRYDDQGNEIKNVKRLPGNTDNWEALGKADSDNRKKEASLPYKVLRKLGMRGKP